MPFHVTLPTSAYWLVKQQTVPHIFSPADTGLSYLWKTSLPAEGYIFPPPAINKYFSSRTFLCFPSSIQMSPFYPFPFSYYFRLLMTSANIGGGGSRFHYTVILCTPLWLVRLRHFLLNPCISCVIFRSSFQIEDAVPKSACAAAGLHPVHAELVLYNLRPAVGRWYMMKW
jgi:hypothetical protein